MKKTIKKYYSMIIIMILILTLGGVISYGVNTYHEKRIVIEENQVVEGDLIAAANETSNEGTITGDWITAAQGIDHRGSVGGDLIGAANSIKVDGKVKGNLRLASNQINILGEVNKNASMFANTVVVGEGAIIDGSIHVFAGDLNIGGFVGGDIIGGAGTAVISGTVKGNVKINVDKIYIQPGAVIEGNLIYTSPQEQVINADLVKGNIEYKTATRTEFQMGMDELTGMIRRVSNVVRIVFLGAYLLIGLLLIKLFTRPYKRASQLIEEKPWYSIGLGAILLIGVPIVGLLLIITIIGIPVSILLMTLYGILIYLAKIPVALWLGGKIIRDENKHYISFIVGSLLIATLGLIPYGGRLTSFGVTALGMGITLIMIKGYYKKEYKDGEAKPPVE